MFDNYLLVIDDVHLEGRPQEMRDAFSETLASQIQEVKRKNKNPILVAAGDISEQTNGIEWLKQFDCETVYVCGNHEFWSGDYYETLELIKKKSNEPGYEKIHFLHNQQTIINGLRFVGGTMWTDLAQNLSWIKKNYILKNFTGMADFKRITAKKFYGSQTNIDNLRKFLFSHGVDEDQVSHLIEHQLYNPLIQLEEHQKTISFIEDTMIDGFEGETIVVTHHLPLYNFWIEIQKMNEQILSAPYINNKNIYLEYQKQKITPDKDILMLGFYANNAQQFFEHDFSPKIWIHGHFHKEVDRYIGTTRIVSSPSGYLRQSETIKVKEISLNPKDEFESFIDNSVKIIEDYDWEGKINNHLDGFLDTIETYSDLMIKNNTNYEKFAPILTTFKKQHEKNLKEVESFVSTILWNLVKLIDKEVKLSDHLYITSYVSGFGKWALKNNIIGIDLLKFTINENSFSQDPKYKKITPKPNEKLFHYTQWVSETKKIIDQTFIFRDALIEFLEEKKLNPKIESKYINNNNNELDI